MLDALITSREKAFEAQLRPEDSIEAPLKTLLKKEVFSTAILILTEEGEERRSETKAPLSLFIFQNLPYASYRLNKNSLEALCFSDYFKTLSQTSGRLSLYPISPVLFKSLLIVAQCDPVMRMPSDVVDKKRLIARIEQNKQEFVLSLKKDEQTALYYFREGKLRDGYFQHSAKEESPENLREKLLLQIDPSRDNALDLALYEASGISGAEDQDQAVEQIAAAVPLEDFVWTKAEKAHTPDPPENGGEDVDAEWGVEFLNGDKTGSIVQITQQYCSLGRGKMDLRLDDPQVSRHHADLEQSQGVLTLIDNKSTNGLFVNEEKIIKKALTKDDIIRLGDTSLKVVRQSQDFQAQNPQARASQT